MRVAIVYNKSETNVINQFGMQNKEVYNPNTVKRVADALEMGGHNVEIIDGNMNVIENIRSFLPPVKNGEKFGMVFNMAYGIQGESRYTHIPAMLEMLGIPYVGSTPAGHAIALDKIITKIILQKNNIPTPDFWFFSSENEDMSDVTYPVIVKPKMESVSFGLKVVYNIDDLKEAVAFIVSEFNQQALVEKFIRGREFAVGLIGNDSVEVMPVLEIDLEGDPDAIQTVDDKQNAPKRKICPADIPFELEQRMKDLSVKVFKSLGLRDFSRVDIRLDENGDIYILEINSMASLSSTGSYVTAASACGYSFSQLVNRMLDVATKRYFTDQYLEDTKTTAAKKLPTSVKIRSYLRNNNENIQKTLEEMININTYHKNIDGVNRLSSIVKKQLNAIGFANVSYAQTEIGNIHFYSNTTEADYDYLIIGNIDNSTRIDQQKYFKMNEHRYFGSGVWENKGGLVTMIYALKSLKHTRLLKRKKIGILMTTDDSRNSSYSRDIIEAKSKCSKAILGIHGAFVDGGLVTSRSGSAFYSLNMTLKKTDDNYDVAKASSIFSKIVSDWSKLSNSENGVIVSPRKISFNSNISEPFVHGELVLSVRFNSLETFEALDKNIRKAIPIKKYKDILDFNFEGGLRRPPMKMNDEDYKLFNRLIDISKQIDIKINEEHRWSSADICLADSTKQRIDGLGPCGVKQNDGYEYIQRHTINEKALLMSLLLSSSE